MVALPSAWVVKEQPLVQSLAALVLANIFPDARLYAKPPPRRTEIEYWFALSGEYVFVC